MSIDFPSSILAEPWPLNKMLASHIHTKSAEHVRDSLMLFFEGQAVTVHNDRSKGNVLLIFDSGGIGKRSAVVDGCAACGFLHVHVDVGECEGIIGVAARAREFFLDRQFLLWCEVISGFQALFQAELAPVLKRCSAAVKDLCKNMPKEGITSRETGEAVHGAVPGMVHVSMPVRPTITGPLGDAWKELRKEVGDRRVLIHFENVERIFTSPDQCPSTRDLLSDGDDEFDVREAPRLVLKALVGTLEPLIRSEINICWAFSGLRPNLERCLNPCETSCSDVSRSIEYFKDVDVFALFLSHMSPSVSFAQPQQLETASERMQFCMRQVAGPPRVIQHFFHALCSLGIRNVDEMYSRWHSIENAITRSLSATLPGLKTATVEDLQRCLLLPIWERSALLWQEVQPDKASVYWNHMVEGGLLRLSKEIADTGYEFTRPYIFLQRILCLNLGISPLVTHLLTNFVVCLELTGQRGLSQSQRGLSQSQRELTRYTRVKVRTLEAVLVALLVVDRTRPVEITSWLRSTLYVCDCVEPSLDWGAILMNSLESNKRDESQSSASEDDQSLLDHGQPCSDLAFDASLCSSVEEYDPDAGADRTRLRADQAPLRADMTYSRGGGYKFGSASEVVSVAVCLTLHGEFSADGTNKGPLETNTEDPSETDTEDLLETDMEDSLIHRICKMIKRAVEQFARTGKRTVILCGGPHLPACHDGLRGKILQELPNWISCEGHAEQELLREELQIDRPLSKRGAIVNEHVSVGDHSVTRFALFYLSSRSSIWTVCEFANIPASAIQAADADEVMDYLLRRFISNAHPSTLIPQKQEKDRSRATRLAFEETQKRRKRKAAMHSVYSSLLEAEVPQDVVSKFKDYVGDRFYALPILSPKLLKGSDLSEIDAEVICAHVKNIYERIVREEAGSSIQRQFNSEAGRFQQS